MSEHGDRDIANINIGSIGRDIEYVTDSGDAAYIAADVVDAVRRALEGRAFGNTYARAAITSALGALQLAEGQLRLAALFVARETSGKL